MCTLPVPQRERTPRKGGQRSPEEGPMPELRCRLESLGRGKGKEEQQQPPPQHHRRPVGPGFFLPS